MKAQEELNNILLAKIHNLQKEKKKEREHNMPKIAPYKCNGRKLEFSSHRDETSSEEWVKHHTQKQRHSSGRWDDNKRKIKYKL